MVCLMFLMDGVLLSFSCIEPCSVDGILYILEHISWYLLWSLATNSFSWLTQASFAILDILYLLDCNFLIKLALISFCCLEHRFFLQHRLFYHFSMPIHCSFSIFSGLSVPLSYFFKFCSIMWFFLPFDFSSWLLLLLPFSSVSSIICSWAVLHFCCHP